VGKDESVRTDQLAAYDRHQAHVKASGRTPLSWRYNLLDLAKSHRLNCNDENCSVSLFLLGQMGKSLGIEFSDEEMKNFK
jgi:hypothetical protein